MNKHFEGKYPAKLTGLVDGVRGQRVQVQGWALDQPQTLIQGPSVWTSGDPDTEGTDWGTPPTMNVLDWESHPMDARSGAAGEVVFSDLRRRVPVEREALQASSSKSLCTAVCL